MPEKAAGDYIYVQREIEADFYSAKLVGFEFLDGEGRVGADGKPFGDSYKLIWEIPDAVENSMWDFVPARFGNNKKTGLVNPLQATINALSGDVIDVQTAPWSTQTASEILEPLIGNEMELYIEPITKDGVTRNKITKRRAFKTRGGPPAKLETTNIQPRV